MGQVLKCFRPGLSAAYLFPTNFNTNIYSGPQIAEKQIYLYHADNQLSVITSMPAFLQKAYFCKHCKVDYTDRVTNICPDSCRCCSNAIKCEFEELVYCDTCQKHFLSNICYQHHLATDTCCLVHYWDDCGKTFHTYRKHTCYEMYCKVCNKNQPNVHKCYIQP